MARPRDISKLSKIIDATIRIFLAKGFDGITMAAVAREANIATGTVYIYFQDKFTLMQQMYATVNIRVAEFMIEDYDDDAPFLVCFRQMWRNYLNFCLKYPDEAWLLDQQLHHSANDKTKALVFEVFKRVESLLDKGKSQGLVAPVPTKLLTAHFIGGIHEVAKWHNGGQLLLANKDFENIYKMSWNSIRR